LIESCCCSRFCVVANSSVRFNVSGHAFIKINKVLYDQNVEINQNAAKSNVKNTEFALQQFKIDKTTQVMLVWKMIKTAK
jgi:hypothetical protein